MMLVVQSHIDRDDDAPRRAKNAFDNESASLRRLLNEWCLQRREQVRQWIDDSLVYSSIAMSCNSTMPPSALMAQPYTRSFTWVTGSIRDDNDGDGDDGNNNTIQQCLDVVVQFDSLRRTVLGDITHAPDVYEVTLQDGIDSSSSPLDIAAVVCRK